ncbi:YsnF/AvaK domain-containing protein [Hymenobacter sp. RP-2-7]|uniref:YsnF/AvaK domain-containing protein n=1 Tax=Hymenobacter polaris TaxID=2682546 RepID=A0A7Y0AAM2_9BACT|nr:YsnF/AvaK domain-containing protein [Hymenobacter polaris]NML63851.1 YsnF/AvaK domain-containing protein [Hymenobacter polaris]
MQPSEPLPPADAAPAQTIPVVAETLRVDKQTVETGRVVLHKTVHVETQTVAVPLRQEQVQVQRIAVGRYVDEAPAVRHEGDTMIVPVLREELVVTKRLLLVEELHVRTQVLTTQDLQTVELRHEEVHYERLTTPDADAPAAGPSSESTLPF